MIPFSVIVNGSTLTALASPRFPRARLNGTAQSAVSSSARAQMVLLREDRGVEVLSEY